MAGTAQPLELDLQAARGLERVQIWLLHSPNTPHWLVLPYFVAGMAQSLELDLQAARGLERVQIWQLHRLIKHFRLADRFEPTKC